MCVAALRRLKTRMIEKKLIEPDTEKGPQKGKRGQPKRRALTDDELAEVFSAVASGGDDRTADRAHRTFDKNACVRGCFDASKACAPRPHRLRHGSSSLIGAPLRTLLPP